MKLKKEMKNCIGDINVCHILPVGSTYLTEAQADDIIRIVEGIDKAIEPIKEWYGGGAEGNRTAIDIVADAISDLQEDRKKALAYDAERWIPADEPPNDIDWEQEVLALECDSTRPQIATMAEIFLDEGSDFEYWRPITLPEKG